MVPRFAAHSSKISVSSVSDVACVKPPESGFGTAPAVRPLRPLTVLTEPRQFPANVFPTLGRTGRNRGCESPSSRSQRLNSGYRLTEFDLNRSLFEHDPSNAIDPRDFQSSRANSWTNHALVNRMLVSRIVGFSSNVKQGASMGVHGAPNTTPTLTLCTVGAK